LCYQERTAKEGYFGSSTPSSQIPLKPNTLAERRSGSHHDILFVISELRQYMALKTALRAIFAPKNRV
jgi:hypothetical protein